MTEKREMRLFKREFLEKLQSMYEHPHEKHMLDSLIEADGLKFHEAILTLAEYKKITPEYI